MNKIIRVCKCGCNKNVTKGREYVRGHNMKGVPKTDIIKEKIRKTLTGKKHPIERILSNSKGQTGKHIGKLNHMYGRSPSMKCHRGNGSFYESPLQGRVHLRSSWEIAYVKYLDSQHILWMYEIETFPLSNEMTYTPDFFLPRTDQFIEIKGAMSPKAQQKINKFKEEYPFELEVLFKKDLQNLGIKL